MLSARSRSRWLLVCLLLGSNVSLVTMKPKKNNFRSTSTVTIPSNQIEPFFRCFCESKHGQCEAEYNNGYVRNIKSKGGNNQSPGNNPRYYTCEDRPQNSALRCHLQDTVPQCPNTNLKHQAFRTKRYSCGDICIVLSWNVDVDFQNIASHVESFDDTCSCPATTTTTTTTTTATTKTKTRATTGTSTTTASSLLSITNTKTPTASSTIDVSHTSDSAAVDSANDESNGDSELGLIIGVVIVVIIIAIIVSVIAFIIWRRKKKQNKSKASQITNNFAGTESFHNVRTSPQNGFTNMNSSYSTLAPYSRISDPGDSMDSHQYAKILDENSVKEAKNKVRSWENATKATPNPTDPGYELAQAVGINGNSSASIPSSEQFGSGDGADYDYCAISDTINTKESDLAKNEVGTGTATSQKEEYGYSTAQDQDIELLTNDTQTASVSQYELAARIETTSKDTGYEFAGPENSYDTPTNNKAAQLNNNIPHETVANMNGTYSLAGNTNETSTENVSGKSKDIYSKLHEDKRQIQNPYNILSQPTDEAITSAPLVGFSHSSQTANQSSGYSFAQPITNGITNQNTDDNSRDDSKGTTSQSHTYHVLEPSTEEGPQEGRENRDQVVKKQNNYFELEKQ